MPRRVVITGLGCVTPLGSTPNRLWQNLLEGKSGVDRITSFDASRYPVRIAAEVRDWSPADVEEDPQAWERAPRQAGFMIGSSLSAARAAGLPDGRIDPVRFGISLGCGEVFEEFSSFARAITRMPAGADGASGFLPAAAAAFDGVAAAEYDPALPAGRIAGLLGAEGPSLNSIAACVSAAQAIGEGWRMIRRGEADVVVAGGAHSMIHPFGLTGFYPLSTLSTRNDEPQRASRPFDRDRDGFVIGEGAAAVVLEELQHARRRGAEVCAELTGYASAHDAYRVTDVHPEGRGSAHAISTALESARIRPEDIDYVNAHGTGTRLNDRIETIALKRALGDHVHRVPISSTKSMLGHAATACAAIELLVCVLAIRRSAIPPTINYETPDPDCDLDYVPNVARERACRHVLSNSIGFGGQNAALIVSRFDNPASGRR